MRGTYVQEEGITCFLLLPCMRHLAPPIPLSHLSPSRGGSTLDGSCPRKLVLPSLSSVLRAGGKVLLGALYSKVKFLHPFPKASPRQLTQALNLCISSFPSLQTLLTSSALHSFLSSLTSSGSFLLSYDQASSVARILIILSNKILSQT